MKNNIYIKLFIISSLVFLSFNSLKSQTKDTLAIIKVKNSQLLDEKTLMFDLYIERQSPRWIKFVNGTFSLNFKDSISYRISPQNTKVGQLRTELRQDVSPGNDIPTTGYRTDMQIYDNRMSITILGPEKYEDCETVELDRPLLLGTFTLSTLEAYLPHYLMDWMEPHSWYQACAFKLESDSALYNLPMYYSDDNLPMEDSTSITYVFVNDTIRKEFKLDYFRAMYVGRLNSQYYWRTIEEYDILGYTVFRGLQIPGAPNTDYSQMIGTWRPGDKFRQEFVVDYNSPNPKLYAYYDDNLEFRGGSYCYSLWGSFVDPRTGEVYDKLLDTACVPAPRSVISFASASPEVFNDETTITYTVDDDVYLTGYLSDLLGKQLKLLDVPEWGLLDKKEVKRGTYTFKFRAPDLSSQGFYNIRFIAYPIDDPTVDESRADVKLQLIK